MRFDLKDVLGIALVSGALATLFVHEGDQRDTVHDSATVSERAVAHDRGSAALTVGDPDTLSDVTVFHDFTLTDLDSREFSEHQTVVVRGNRIEWIGPFDAAPVPTGARVFRGFGARYLLPADADRSPGPRALDVGDPANVLVVSDDPVEHPESLDEPLCVMRRGVVVSLSPSLAADG